MMNAGGFTLLFACADLIDAGIGVVWVGDAGERNDRFFLLSGVTAGAAFRFGAEVAVVGEVVDLEPIERDRDGDGEDRPRRQRTGKDGGVDRRNATVDRLAVDGDAQLPAYNIGVVLCQREGEEIEI